MKISKSKLGIITTLISIIGMNVVIIPVLNDICLLSKILLIIFMLSAYIGIVLIESD